MKLVGMVVFWIANLTSLTSQTNHCTSHSKNVQKCIEETDRITKAMGWCIFMIQILLFYIFKYIGVLVIFIMCHM